MLLVSARPLDWSELGDILREEIIEHGADDGDHPELGDVVPGGRHRGAHEIGGECKFESKQNPSRESDPDLPPFHLIGGPPEHHCHNNADESLGCAEGNDKHGARLDEERDVARDLGELLFEWNGCFPAPRSRLTRSLRGAQVRSAVAGAGLISESTHFWPTVAQGAAISS